MIAMSNGADNPIEMAKELISKLFGADSIDYKNKKNKPKKKNNMSKERLKEIESHLTEEPLLA